MRAVTSLRGGLPWVLTFTLSVAFRVPALLNAAGVNSDAAIVGLQGMHILRGEWSPLLFGSAYQTSVDSAVAALFFAVGGAGPLALMLSTLAGHVILTFLVFAMLERRLGAWPALVLILPLVFAPPSVHTYVLHPPRQASLTLAFASLFVLDRAEKSVLAFGAGGALATLACFADPYALLILPVALLFAALTAREWRKRGAAACGFAIGALPLVWLWNQPGAKHGTVGLTFGVLEHNWRLFADTCLPWGLSYQAWLEQDGCWVPWSAPLPVRALQLAGALVLVAGVLFVPFARRVPRQVLSIGIAGLAAWVFTIVGFLTSVMVMDHFSTRYLATLVLAAPLALAPLAYVAGTRRFAAILAPYVASAALNGWLGFVPWTSGLRIVRTDDGVARDETSLERELAARGVTCAMADYWVSYRLTFLWAERIIVVPKNQIEDRYAPYVGAFDRAPLVAYVFDPDRSREAYESIPEQLEARGVHAAAAEWIRAGRLTALVVKRAE